VINNIGARIKRDYQAVNKRYEKKINNIGARIKRARIDAGFSVEELAQRIGKNRATIYRYERGEIADLPTTILEPLARALNTTPAELMGWDYEDISSPSKGVKIPVLGSVAAGVPISAISNIEDYEEITPEMAKSGEHFALRVKGDSMSPRIDNNDIVIVRQQALVNNGDVAVVLGNGDEATVKEIKKLPDGLMLIGWNTSVYPPKVYSKEDVEKLPVSIIGKVVELRRKF